MNNHKTTISVAASTSATVSVAIQYEVFNFDLDSWSEVRCLEYFRFTKSDVVSLSLKLGLDLIKYPYLIKPSQTLAFCIVLARLSSPSRYKDTLYLFGRSCTYQSIIFNTVHSFLYDRFRNILHWDKRCLDVRMIKSFPNSIKEIGGPENIWGFPEDEQHQFYTGYKWCHAIKFQGITTPDGLIASLIGQFEGKLGDWMIFDEDIEESRVFLYGDPAYSLSFGLIYPFRNTAKYQMTEEERAFNTKMSGYQIAVEHCFGKVVKLWSFLAFKNGLQVGLSPVGTYYAIAVLLTNLNTCLYGSQISLQFKVTPPSVNHYWGLEF
ncbi:hypothetical protein L873DRAFT_1827136 [Choiromyces venosus 120613-1]|uniref:DDE Tnp4 domain-containing protein n=1 Tax=Choiromyces venosus 120613-1 TaxID=1336337 RepID=A0A3N4JT24_9PEZI|nr:hypothetical protein L873DRAFT_1827136 [Choiromyces venosus 120613-1]